jgi:hypothetical protein
MWFKKLVGFKEQNPEDVRMKLLEKDGFITSKINKKMFQVGTLEIPTLKELRSNISLEKEDSKQISIREVVGDVKKLHQEKENEGAVFQAASQFNLLEMIDSHVTPEDGIDRYEYDRTQGPACAIACGAGTIYRNYFVRIGHQIGQTEAVQIDCLDEIGKALGNKNASLWAMKNGYALLNLDGLTQIANQISSLTELEYEYLKGLLKIGLQWNTEVTLSEEKQLVTQAYCSALPISYAKPKLPTELWEKFARLILEGTYEATFYAALKNYQQIGNKKLYLTLVGGGVFGNEQNWVFDAIEKAFIKFKNTPLEVMIVSYGDSNKDVKAFCKKLNK